MLEEDLLKTAGSLLFRMRIINSYLYGKNKLYLKLKED